MLVYIVTTPIGCFAVNEKNDIIRYILFSKDPEKIAKKIISSEQQLLPEEKQLVNELRKMGYQKIIFSTKKPGVTDVEPHNAAETFIRNNLPKLAIAKKFVRNQIEFNNFITSLNTEITRFRIKESITRDALIVQTVRAIEELNKSINIFAERLREWYALHFPEMDRAVDDHLKFAKIVKKYGSRCSIKHPELASIKKKSMGADFTPRDIQVMQRFADGLISLYKLREKLSNYLEKICREIAPNFTALAGPTITAKMIAKAGSLEKLAKMPSSTIQLIGAEKALFRFLHSKKRIKPPKYGILFMHPIIQTAPKKLRGKLARAISSKLSVAAKLDYYSKKDKSSELKRELEERVKEVLASNKR